MNRHRRTRAVRRQREAFANRVEHVCRTAFGRPWGRWSEVWWTTDGQPYGEIHTPVGKLDRARFQEELDRWTGIRWRYQWVDHARPDAHLGLLRISPNPTGLDYGAPDHVFDTHPDGILIGATVDSLHRPVHWQPTDAPRHHPDAVVLRTPHLGVLGSTGGGKSVLLRCVGAGTLARGERLAICDYPKGTGFLPFLDRAWIARDLPNVVAILRYAYSVATARFDLMWESRGEWSMDAIVDDDGGGLVVICDEFPRLRPRTGDAPQIKKLKDEARGLAWDILGATREGRVHLVLGAQQGNAEVFGSTEQRSNMRAMVSAWQEPEGARQARLPEAARLDPDQLGRWVAADRGRTIEFQAYNLPATGTYIRERFGVPAGEWPPSAAQHAPRSSARAGLPRASIAGRDTKPGSVPQ